MKSNFILLTIVVAMFAFLSSFIPAGSETSDGEYVYVAIKYHTVVVAYNSGTTETTDLSSKASVKAVEENALAITSILNGLNQKGYRLVSSSNDSFVFQK